MPPPINFRSNLGVHAKIIMETQTEGGVHQRLLRLRDVALGARKEVPVSSCLAPASYDCTVDSLMALFSECKGASTLAKDKNVLKFINKCMHAVDGGVLLIKAEPKIVESLV